MRDRTKKVMFSVMFTLWAVAAVGAALAVKDGLWVSAVWLAAAAVADMFAIFTIDDRM